MSTDVVGELVTVLCTVQCIIEDDFVRRAFGSSSSLQYVVSTDNRISRQPLYRKCLYFGKILGHVVRDFTASYESA